MKKAGQPNLGPSTLEGKYVRMEPLRMRHRDALYEVAKRLDWKWFLEPLLTKEDVRKRILHGLQSERRNEAYAFAVKVRRGSRVVGSTSYMTIVPGYKRAEVGSTWYAPDVWGTVVNPECKYLLFRHAFEEWGAVRIQLVTDEHNLHSQRAISKLGAKFEGRLRNYGIRPDGSYRTSMVYSITSEEWPGVRAGLSRRITAFSGG